MFKQQSVLFLTSKFAAFAAAVIVGVAVVGAWAAPARSAPIDIAFTEIVTLDTEIPDGVGTFTGISGVAFDGTDFAFRGFGPRRVTPGRGNIPQQGIYSTVGGLHRVADLLTEVPGLGFSTLFRQFQSPELGGGQTAFRAQYSNTTGGSPSDLFSDIGGGVNRIAGTGTPIPDSGGAVFSSPENPTIDGSKFAFTGAARRLELEGHL